MIPPPVSSPEASPRQEESIGPPGRRQVVGPPPVGDGKRPFIQRLFTSIAPRYDWFNRLSSLGLDQGWRRTAVARARVARGMRVLDVCTGTGDLALRCAGEQGGQGLVIGADMNASMLAGARRKQRRQGASVAWLQADALGLPFPDARFDRVLVGFSTRNFTDLTAGLAEMVRVLRPGGQLLILETGRPSHPLVRAGYHAYLFTVSPAIGLLLTGRLWPFTYLARSVRGFLAPSEFVARLQRLGSSVAYVPLSGGLASLYVATKEGQR